MFLTYFISYRTILLINTLFHFIKYGAEKVSWHHYNKLYLFERDTSPRIGWKLKELHMHPNSFQKMRVSPAV